MRRLFGPVFILAGILHFLIPGVYESIVPEYLPARRALVYASGIAEIVGGLGVLNRRTRRLASWLNMATLVGVSPVHVDMVVHSERWDHKVPGGRPALLARLPLQGLLIAWARAAGR
ncbi:MAG: DoxX family membrane protein [Actinomycetota bacterium]|nr:DoxX family membrane protein [Actinomycetota bacterium]